MKVLVSLSGGMDSATLVGKALAEGHTVSVIHFQYGSKHNRMERKAAMSLLQHYKIGAIASVDLSRSGLTDSIRSHLLTNGGSIPEGHYQDETMKQTVVPGRNLIFASMAAAVAESQGIDQIWLGIHTGDHAIYPDCRPEFLRGLQDTVKASTEGRVAVEAPFLDLDKHRILEIGYEIRVPYDKTWTCYNPYPISCGKCGSCQERIEGFRKLGKVDPLRYAIDIDWSAGAVEESEPIVRSNELDDEALGNPMSMAAPKKKFKKR